MRTLPPGSRVRVRDSVPVERYGFVVGFYGLGHWITFVVYSFLRERITLFSFAFRKQREK